jgi:hypothetical protein
VNAKNTALTELDGHVLRLLQMIRGRRKPDRFAKTAAKADDLTKISKFFADLARLKAEAAAP